MRRHLGAVIVAVVMAAAGAAHADNTGDLVDRTRLRVCADPAHLPFSNEQGQGFENRIAELMAAKLNVPVAYTWYPDTVGFVRNTLRAGVCDLIMGVVSGEDLVQNTNPYYRSAYVLVRRAADKDLFASLNAPEMQTATIGVVAGTPPADMLVRANLVAQERPYQLLNDSRQADPARAMMDDLAGGRIDVALVWGPIGGYWAKKEHADLLLTPMPDERRNGIRNDFRISMGIRQGEPEWKHEVNNLIRTLQPQITGILQDYGVPLLDPMGRLIKAAVDDDGTGTSATPGTNVPEPAGYRLDHYRAPVPATLKGATVVDTAALKDLVATRHPLLVDVLKRARKPPGRSPDQVWIEPRRMDLPGSAWLPNTGYGELAPEFRRYLADELARLSGGDRARPIVFYCETNCWMSWNAAKRALTELGYTNVYWYPEGVQGWQKAGGRLVDAGVPTMPAFAGN